MQEEMGQLSDGSIEVFSAHELEDEARIKDVYGLGSHIGSHIEILNIELSFWYLRNLRKNFLLFYYFLLTCLQYLS